MIVFTQQHLPLVMDVHSQKILIDPANLQLSHPIFSKLKTKTIELLLEESGDLIRLQPGQFLYKHDQKASSGFIIISGKLQLWNLSHGNFGSVIPGDTLGEDILLDDKLYKFSQENYNYTEDCVRQENAEALEETCVFEINRDKWKLMNEILIKIRLQIDFFTLTNIMKKNFTKRKAWMRFKHNGVNQLLFRASKDQRIVDQTLSDQISTLIGGGKDKEKDVKEMKNMLKIPEKYYYMMAIRGFARANNWDDLYYFINMKKSPVTYSFLAELCIEYGKIPMAVEAIKKWLVYIEYYDEKIPMLIDIAQWRDAIEESFIGKRLEFLDEIRQKGPTFVEDFIREEMVKRGAK